MASRLLVLLLLALCISVAYGKEDIHVAVASSLRAPITEIAQSLEQRYPNYRVQLSYAATGKLVAQVQHGAPYHILIAADPYYLNVLKELNLLAAAPRIFAYGEVVLWHPEQTGRLESLLRNARHIGIAQPRHAPYGQAAIAFLEQQKWLTAVQDRFIYAENAAQVIHRVYAGAVPMGFVALSQVIELGGTAQHYSHLNNAPLLAHTAALSKHGETSEGASLILAMLWSEAGQQIMLRYGYQKITDDQELLYAAGE